MTLLCEMTWQRLNEDRVIRGDQPLGHAMAAEPARPTHPKQVLRPGLFGTSILANMRYYNFMPESGVPGQVERNEGTGLSRPKSLHRAKDVHIHWAVGGRV